MSFHPSEGGQIGWRALDALAANCAAAEAHGWLSIHHADTQTTIARLRSLRRR